MLNATVAKFASKLNDRLLRSSTQTRKVHHVRHPRVRDSAVLNTEQPQETSGDDSRTLRLRRHGNKSLPLPPAMDPIVVEARARNKKSKAAYVPQVKTEFQRQLEGNVHGQCVS